MDTKLVTNIDTLSDSNLNYNDVRRYKRQMILKEIGVDGQLKLKNSKILIVGAGGIGSPLILYLAGSGIGTIGIIDGDAHSANLSVANFNPLVNCIVYEENLNSENAESIIKEFDIVIDASDSPIAKYLANDVCILLKKTLVGCAALGWEGQISVYNQNGPCYRCLFPECPKPSQTMTCASGGVIGAVPGMVGMIAVNNFDLGSRSDKNPDEQRRSS